MFDKMNAELEELRQFKSEHKHCSKQSESKTSLEASGGGECCDDCGEDETSSSCEPLDPNYNSNLNTTLEKTEPNVQELNDTDANEGSVPIQSLTKMLWARYRVAQIKIFHFKDRSFRNHVFSLLSK